jgi:hypothetical protein
MQTFFSIIPKDSPMIAKWNETTHDLWLKTPGGVDSLIMFRGADEYTQFGSYELGWFWIDQAEQVSEQVFKMLQSRLSKRGVKLSGIITPNPPSQYHWIYRTFRNADPQKYWSIHTSTYDNMEYLPPGYVEELEKQPESWKKMYLYGEYGFMAEGDPVFLVFNEELNVAKESLVWYKAEPIVRSWDFGYRFPACGWFQYVPSLDRVHKLRELVLPNTIIDHFADMVIRESIDRFPGAYFEDVGDPAGNQKSDKSERSSVEIVNSKLGPGHSVQCFPSFVNDGVIALRRALIPRDDGMPAYVIDPSCQTTIDAYRGGYFLADPASGVPDKECHPYCDVIDTDRYFFVNKVSLVKKLPRKSTHYRKIDRGVTGY